MDMILLVTLVVNNTTKSGVVWNYQVLIRKISRKFFIKFIKLLIICLIFYRYLFFMDLKHPRKALKVCVKQCPSKKIESIDELKQFYEESGSNLCKYNYNFSQVANAAAAKALSGSLGPCPVLPVFERFYNFLIFIHLQQTFEFL